MRRRISQQGDAMAIIFAVLIVALMAALGVIFYQNFAGKNTENTKQASGENRQAADAEKTKRIALRNNIYALDYPENWTVSSDAVAESAENGSITKFTSPDGTVRASFTLSQISIEPTCDQVMQIFDYSVEAGAATQLTSEPLSLVAATIGNEKGGYDYKIGLVPDGGDTHAKVGDSSCIVKNVGLVSNTRLGEIKKNEAAPLLAPTIFANIEFPKLAEPPQAAAKDRQTIKDLMATDNYKVAIKILESARKE